MQFIPNVLRGGVSSTQPAYESGRFTLLPNIRRLVVLFGLLWVSLIASAHLSEVSNPIWEKHATAANINKRPYAIAIKNTVGAEKLFVFFLDKNDKLCYKMSAGVLNLDKNDPKINWLSEEPNCFSNIQSDVGPAVVYDENNHIIVFTVSHSKSHGSILEYSVFDVNTRKISSPMQAGYFNTNKNLNAIVKKQDNQFIYQLTAEGKSVSCHSDGSLAISCQPEQRDVFAVKSAPSEQCLTHCFTFYPGNSALVTHLGTDYYMVVMHKGHTRCQRQGTGYHCVVGDDDSRGLLMATTEKLAQYPVDSPAWKDSNLLRNGAFLIMTDGALFPLVYQDELFLFSIYGKSNNFYFGHMMQYSGLSLVDENQAAIQPGLEQLLIFKQEHEPFTFMSGKYVEAKHGVTAAIFRGYLYLFFKGDSNDKLQYYVHYRVE